MKPFINDVQPAARLYLQNAASVKALSLGRGLGEGERYHKF